MISAIVNHEDDLVVPLALCRTPRTRCRKLRFAAWRYRDSLQEGAPLRPWLYRQATNACLDAMARDERRAVLAARAAADDGWIGEPEDVV